MARVGRDAAVMQIQRNIADERVWLCTDLDRLNQVFLNLIVNAHKYCDAADPKLQIIVRQSAQQLTIDFIDNGSGISNEDQNLIFEKFSRIGGHESGGAGLGLAISREILQRLQGDITYLPGQNGGRFPVFGCQKVLLAVLRELTCHQRINRRLK